MNNKEIAVTFTFPNNLHTWIETGLVDREFRIYEALREKGYRFTFFTYDTGLQYRYRNHKIIPMCKKPGGKLSLLLQSVCFAFLHKKEIHFKYVKTNQLWGGWIALILSWRYKADLLLRSGYEYFGFKSKITTNSKLFFHFIICFLLYHAAKKIVLPTAEDKEFVEKKFHINNQKIKIIPNWIDSNLFKPLIPYSNRIYDLIWIGRISDQKDPDFFKELLLKSDALKICFISDQEKSESEQFFDEALQVKQHSIDFCSSLSNSDIAALLQQSKIFVSTSKYEGNPKVVLEAMFSQVVVICRNKPGLNNLIDDRVEGLHLHELDHVKNAQIIHGVIDGSIDIKPLVDNALNTVMQTNSLEKVVNLEKELYE